MVYELASGGSVPPRLSVQPGIFSSRPGLFPWSAAGLSALVHNRALRRQHPLDFRVLGTSQKVPGWLISEKLSRSSQRMHVNSWWTMSAEIVLDLSLT